MRALGAVIVPVSYEQAWQAAEAHEFEGLEGTFVHPFDNHDFIAGHGTMGLENSRGLARGADRHRGDRRRRLVTGVGSALKALRPDIKVLGAEPETAAPYALSLRKGGPQRFPDWKSSFVDGTKEGRASPSACGGQRVSFVVDGWITVTLDQTREAMRLIAWKSRTIAEGAGALALAAALTGEAGEGPIVCVVSGGNVDLKTFAELVAS